MTPRNMIAAALRDGRRWTRSFQAFKTVLHAMIEDGEVHRVRPPMGRGANMVELTGRGWSKYFGENLLVTRLDNFAELLADGIDPENAARILNISQAQAQSTFRAICVQVGAQAA